MADEITLPGDLAGLVKRWTSDGTMKFRWPTDDERNYKVSGDKWGGEEVADELNRLNPEATIKTALQNNEGPAIDAFADYWRDVPARNVQDLTMSFKRVSAALLAMNAALIAYKNAAIESLPDLKKELDDNEKWAWLPWSDDGAIHKRAVALIGNFDEMDQFNVDQFHGTMANSVAIIKQEAKLYDDIAKRFTPDTEKTGDRLNDE
ncbi:hypothetical protein [Actinoallomurus iriomotensis]|uniref:Uncharacterized protein n=1 Tax=Actinoallomurus iriomotensis TaxID=478107 RepID=A0A9W6VWL1_9ACTN|nr:hypothetical protein [Actinoallomurus iriomotensis]GLY87938.1 hypothetical protein Airi02_058670 [Actinoallomurus iriomotensis]